MTKRELIERTAAGLRRMDTKPDFLIYCDGILEETWDEETICAIPVLHTTLSVNPGYDGDTFPFHPVFKTENTTTFKDVYNFQRGFKDLC